MADTQASPARNFIPIDRATFRPNSDAGLTSKMVPGLRSYRIVEANRTSAAEWENVGPIAESVDAGVFVITGGFVCVAWENLPLELGLVARTFRSDTPGVRIEPNDHCRLASWGTPAPAYLFQYQDAIVTCPNGHRHRMSELDDYEDDDTWATDLCPTCGDAVEGIERERPEDVAVELGIKKG